MVKHGFYNFLNWFDERAWYPLGRIVGGTVYPGLMITSGSIHYLLHLLNINVHIRDVCVFLAPIFRYFNYRLDSAVVKFSMLQWSDGHIDVLSDQRTVVSWCWPFCSMFHCHCAWLHQSFCCWKL